MDFKQFKEKLQRNFTEITTDADHLFEVGLDTEILWNLYLDSFPNGTNIIFRERREFDCSCCRQFIKTVGNVVALKDGKITTIWGFELGDSKFQPVIDILDEFVKSKTIENVFVSEFKSIGVDNNKELMPNGEVHSWEHFYLDIPNKFVNNSRKSESELKGEMRATKEVFKRGLEEVTIDSIETVLDLIGENTLYKGEEWKVQLELFLEIKKERNKITDIKEKDLYVWEKAVLINSSIARIRNSSIGTLLVNLSENMDLELAVKKYEIIVAPENYKRSTPVYSKKMLEDAKTLIQELGYIDSLPRRHATLDDISVNDILFSNKDSAKQMKDFDVFDEMSDDIPVNPKKYDKVEEISVDDFISNILPSAREIELLLENKHVSNMASLIAPVNEMAKSMFKWNNPYSWAYTGNITDSSMRDRVKSAGGNVEGVLRFSIQWNDGDEHNRNDLDAHALEPRGNRLYYAQRRNGNTTGQLDVDIQHPEKSEIAVENITWLDKNKMEVGVYKLIVHNFSHRGGRDGFSAEVEFDGKIHSFVYDKDIRNDEYIEVAQVTLDENGKLTIVEKLPSTVSSKEIWGLKTNKFIPVSVVTLSPNYWGEENGVGNKHTFFMLKNCINSESPNSMYVEFLKNKLNVHRKVFEAIGGKMKVESVEHQLSGVGFSSTQRNEATVKVITDVEKLFKIKF